MISSTGRTSTAEALQANGREAYKQKDYARAYKFFSEALLTSPPPMVRIGLLDNRSATLSKLHEASSSSSGPAPNVVTTNATKSTLTKSTDGKGSKGHDRLKEALLDAREMIRIDKKDVKGYLRAGKILIQMEKPDVALNTYKYGLASVHPEDKHRGLLEGMHTKALELVRVSEVGTKMLDPLLLLPFELVDMILGHLTFRSLILCQRVCKHWCHFFRTSYINTFTKLDFSEARRPVKKTTLKNYITRSRGAVTDVILNRMGWEANETIPYIVSRCKNLSAIQINTDCFVSNSLSAASLIGENLTKIVLECTTTSSCVVDILNNCRKLEILECTNVEDGSSEFWYTTPSPLRRLKLGSQVSRITPVNFRQSIGNLDALPNLTELILTTWNYAYPVTIGTPGNIDFSTTACLTTLTLSKTNLALPYPLLPPTLTHLSFDECYHIRFSIDTIHNYPLPNLVLLSARETKISGEDLLEILRPGAENGTLKFLELGDCARIDVEELNWLMDDVNDVEISPNVGLNLEYLGLSGNVTFSDEFSRKFGRLKKLSKIDASRTRISGVGLMNLVNNPRGCVKEMLINGCEVGIDAVELARKKGCVVRWRELGDKLKGGRQVRYRY